jgi:dATP pyrophosphohydrolase
VLRESGTVNRFQIVPEALHWYADGVTENTEYVFFLELTAPCVVQLNYKEHEAYRWQPLADAIDSVWSWSNKQALEALTEQFPTKIVD